MAGSWSLLLATAFMVVPGCRGFWSPALLPVGFQNRATSSPIELRRTHGGRTGQRVGASIKMAYHVFFDVALREHDEAVGRMIFEIDDDLPTKKSLENFRALVTGERAALDASLKYQESTFETGNAYTSGGNYKWSHVCKGRGKNIFGKEKIEEVRRHPASRPPSHSSRHTIGSPACGNAA